MRNANEGVALAAIVAKETTEGTWRGSGGGLGFGTGGLGLFVGGMSGTKREQSQRAKEFEAPPKASFNMLYVFGPLLGLMFIGVMFGVAAPMLDFISAGSPEPSGPGGLAAAQRQLGEVVGMLGKFVPILVVIGCAAYFIFGRGKREEEETARYEAAKARDAIREAVYYRLRYVERDHVVFDPVTGAEAPAAREAILALIEQIAEGEAAPQEGPKS
ncbi:TPA: hypothetical protein ACRNL1_005379 [Pseudomonas aeruginosa]